MELSFIILCIVILLIVYVGSRFVIVTTNHVVVCATIGRRFTRILKEGFQLKSVLEWPIEFNWTFMDQQYKTHHIKGNQLRLTGVQIDMAPMECKTLDNYDVSVDTLLVYKVVDPEKAAYATSDPLNLLCQQVIKYGRIQVKKYKKDDLPNYESDVGKDICAAIAKEWTPVYGLSLESCEIQNISSDEDTLRRRRQFRDGLSPQERSQIEQAHALSSGTGINKFLSINNK
jgi:regulator of protease activity HflC (stomatin/prohibitin superfamily)